MAFTGYTPGSILFLKELAPNNNKDWFEKNRGRYEELILEPLKQLATGLGPIINSIDAHVETTPAINKTISRIYRDTRFSNDKSPYRTDAWLSFKRPFKIWGNAPEFYFYFTPEEYQYGMGFYAATPENMGKFREHIDANPDNFKKIIDYYDKQESFVLLGESYKKQITNSHPAEFQPWFQKKNLCMSHIRKLDDVFFSKQLAVDLEEAYQYNAELYCFLMESIVV